MQKGKTNGGFAKGLPSLQRDFGANPVGSPMARTVGGSDNSAFPETSKVRSKFKVHILIRSTWTGALPVDK